MKKRETFTADNTGIGAAIDYVRDFLYANKIRGRELTKAVLAAEEAIGSLVSHKNSSGHEIDRSADPANPIADKANSSDDKGKLILTARHRFGTVTLDISCPGYEYDFADSIDIASVASENEAGTDIQDSLRSILLKAFSDNLKYRHKDRINTINMVLIRSRRAAVYYTLGALLAGVLIGFILNLIGNDGLNAGVNKYVFIPIRTMFLNALKVIVAPVVFFSIASCISQFSSLSDLGRIGGRVLSFYLITTILAVAIGIGSYFLFTPGGEMSDIPVSQSVTEGSDLGHMLLNTIVGIVPDNLVKPFLEPNMLQLIFLAVLFGAAVGMIGRYTKVLRELFEALSDFFIKITMIIMRFIPLAVFCAMSSMMITLGSKTLISVLEMSLTFFFGLLMMILVYSIMLLVFGRINPLVFFRKYGSSMLQVFSLASSSASIPVNMDACEKDLGISKRVYSLSIPLGATINMDGVCVMLGVFSLALANVYGVSITGSAIFSLALSIIILSVGAPGVPGSVVICLTVLLSQMNVPVEARGIVMGVGPFLGMFFTMTNCLGDVVVSTIVAKKEGMLDMDTLNKSRS
ncbi:MAG: dicarboxylate/amino acid:cation symporter [Eubacterium sp.]|nr:dicarboxylate/amino acid:cation symporter [Eubacterium sp.]